MDIPPALERGITVLNANRYLILATNDNEGPWAAALAFTPAAPRHLYFASQLSSRHASAIAQNAHVAGVICDTSASTDDVESIQFSGTCARVDRDRSQVALMLQRSAVLMNGPRPSEEEIDAFMNDERIGAFRIDITRAFVLDQRIFLEEGIDAREEFSVEPMFQAIEKSFSG